MADSQTPASADKKAVFVKSYYPFQHRIIYNGLPDFSSAFTVPLNESAWIYRRAVIAGKKALGGKGIKETGVFCFLDFHRKFGSADEKQAA